MKTRFQDWSLRHGSEGDSRKTRFRDWFLRHVSKGDSRKTRFRLWSIYLCVCILGVSIILIGMPKFAASAAGNPKHHTVNGSGIRTCAGGWVYNDVSVLAYPFLQFGPNYQNYNGTNHDENDTFVTWTQGRVQVRVEHGFFVDLNAVLFSVGRTTNRSVEKEIEVNVGNSVNVSVPAHMSVYAHFGVYEIKARGHYFYQDQFCNDLIDGGTLTSWCPWYAGWSTWIVDPSRGEIVR